MCGRYAASRKPEDLASSSRRCRPSGQQPLPADYNVAPTKDVYVVRHKKERDAEGAPDRRRAPRAAGGALGAGALVGQGRVGRQPDAQRPGRVADREAGVPEGRAPPGAAWCRPTAGTSGPSGWTRRPSSRTSSRREDGSVLAFAGLWEVWGRGEDRLYTCTVVTAPGRRRAAPRSTTGCRWSSRPTAGPTGWTRRREDVERADRADPAGGRRGARAAAGEHRGEQRGATTAGS